MHHHFAFQNGAHTERVGNSGRRDEIIFMRKREKIFHELLLQFGENARSIIESTLNEEDLSSGEMPSLLAHLKNKIAIKLQPPKIA